MSGSAQPLGLGQACSAAEGSGAARPAVFHTGSPGGLTESALGRGKDAAQAESLEASQGPTRKWAEGSPTSRWTRRPGAEGLLRPEPPRREVWEGKAPGVGPGGSGSL